MLDEAIAVSDKALALNPYSAAAYDRKAWCYARQTPAGYDERQSCNSAIELNAKKAVALEPEDPAHYNTLSLAYDAQDLPELVLECYQKAIRLPTCTPSERALYYVNSAGAYFKMSKDEKALESTDSALAIDSASTMALTMRARILLYRDRADSAKVAIDRALATHWERRLDKGTQFDLLLLAAMIEAVLRDYDRALAHVVRALEMQPSDKPAQELYAHIKRNIK
jgi:tetratricopeptide (TPR) repeat protein